MTNKKKPLLFFFFVLIVTGYYLLFYNDTPNYTIEFFENGTVKSVGYNDIKVPESFGFGIYHSNNTMVGMNLTQFLEENESFDGYIRITNAIQRENQYLLFALVDYRAVPLYINGNKNFTHIVNLSSMEDNFYPFRIDNLSNGYHDLLLGVFLNPYEHSLDWDYRMRTDFALMGSRRVNIVVGNGSKPVINFRGFKEFCEPSYSLDGILVNKDSCSRRAWTVQNVSKGEILEYSINIGNKNRNQRTFALVQFLDYEQIPIYSNSSKYVYFGYLNKDQDGSVPANLISPTHEGVHELIVVWIEDPFENLEIYPGIRNRNLGARVEPSIRIGLNVVEKDE